MEEEEEDTPTEEELNLLKKVLNVPEVLSVEEAVDRVFACDCAEPKFRPETRY
jgi:hypothetical protein